MGKNIGNAKYFSEEDLRFATSLDVAEYRAERLKCSKIVDLCSGIGIQAGAFAKTCKEVYGFEIDERKVKYAEKNFKHIKNIKFFVGDVLDEKVIEQVRKIKPDIIFCDPERLAEEKERNLDSIKPDIKKLINVYSRVCENICLEVPPQIEINKLKVLGNFEAEYLSVNNKLNRLNLYFGELKKSDVSVVDIISRVRLENSKEEIKISKVRNISRNVYEVSAAIIKAGLINEFAREIKANVIEGCENNKILLTSDKISKSHSTDLSKVYLFFGICRSLEDVNKILKRDNFAKVVLKYSIEPKDYWKERNRIEKDLFGNRAAVVFKVNDSYVVCEEV